MTEYTPVDGTSVDGLGLWPEDLDPARGDPAGLWSQELFESGTSEFGYGMLASRNQSPSAPIILLSAAAGLLFGMIAFYLAYQLLWLRAEIATGISLIALFIGLAITSIGLSNLTHSTAMVSNLTFSCGLILLSVLFFGLCIVTGALGATVLLLLST